MLKHTAFCLVPLLKFSFVVVVVVVAVAVAVASVVGAFIDSSFEMQGSIFPRLVARNTGR